MEIRNEPKLVKEVQCDRCKTIISDIKIKDLSWYHAELHFNQPHIYCPVCDNEIYDILIEED